MTLNQYTNANRAKEMRNISEVWKSIKGFEGLYEASSEGRIRSLDRKVKNAKGKLRPEQKRFAEFAAGQPIIYGVARSKEDAIHIIENGLNGYGV